MQNDQRESEDIFITEANQQLDSLQSILMDVEKEGSFSASNVAELFRLVHTLKSSSAMMGYTDLSQTTHHFEDILSRLREDVGKNQPLSAELIEQVIDLGLSFSDLYHFVISQPKSLSLTEKCAEMNQKLKLFHLDSAESDEPTGKKKIEKDSYPLDLFLYDRVHIRLKHCGMPSMRAFMFELAITHSCEKVYTIPSHIKDREDCNDRILQDGFELGYVRKANVSGISILEIIRRQPLFDSLSLISAAVSSQSNEKASIGENLSVKTQNVDELLGLVDEAIVDEVYLNRRLEKLGIKDVNLDNRQKELRNCLISIQRKLRDMGLVEIGQIFLPMKRLIRSILIDTNKKAEAEFSGGTVMVEKGVQEVLNDVMPHLIRNALDHGIETPEERIAAGKSEVGRIGISAKREREYLVLSVEDDGRGVDQTVVLQKAKELGLLTKPENEYSQSEIMKFLLESGFSTKEGISKYSGRGVGLDVVHAVVAKAGGWMNFSSQKGKGSVLTMTLPVSLTTMDTLKVIVRNEFVIYIPVSTIYKVIARDENDIIKPDARVTFEGEEYISLNTADCDHTQALVLFQRDGKKFFLPCQKINEYETIIAKELPASAVELLGNESIYLGCMIDTIGRVRFILDIGLMMQKKEAFGIK